MTTTNEALGSGLDFQEEFDINLDAGSVGTVAGIDKLGVDIAFALHRQVRESDTQIRGRRFNPNLREDLRILVRRVMSRESRVDRVHSITITETDEASTTAEVAVELTAATDERGEFVFAV